MLQNVNYELLKRYDTIRKNSEKLFKAMEILIPEDIWDSEWGKYWGQVEDLIVQAAVDPEFKYDNKYDVLTELWSDFYNQPGKMVDSMQHMAEYLKDAYQSFLIDPDIQNDFLELYDPSDTDADIMQDSYEVKQ